MGNCWLGAGRNPFRSLRSCSLLSYGKSLTSWLSHALACLSLVILLVLPFSRIGVDIVVFCCNFRGLLLFVLCPVVPVFACAFVCITSILFFRVLTVAVALHVRCQVGPDAQKDLLAFTYYLTVRFPMLFCVLPVVPVFSFVLSLLGKLMTTFCEVVRQFLRPSVCRCCLFYRVVIVCCYCVVSWCLQPFSSFLLRLDIVV